MSLLTSAPLHLTYAGGLYDRTAPLATGEVRPEGIDLNYVPVVPPEAFWRQLKHNEFDVSEMSCANYLTVFSRGDRRFVAIPVYPSRTFRHSAVYINPANGIKRPEDLKGRRIGCAEYYMTMAIWQRAFLQHDRLSIADIRAKPCARGWPSRDHRAPPGWTGVAQIEAPNAETRRRRNRQFIGCRRRETDDEVDRRPTIRGQRLGPPIRYRDLEPFARCQVMAPAPRERRRRPAGHRPHRQADTRQLELLQTGCLPVAKPAVGRRNNCKSHRVKQMPR